MESGLPVSSPLLGGGGITEILLKPTPHHFNKPPVVILLQNSLVCEIYRHSLKVKHDDHKVMPVPGSISTIEIFMYVISGL
jgi:hypothetical protein